MSWNQYRQLGGTIRRSVLDQSVVVGSVAGGQVRVPFGPLATTGFLRAINLRSPLLSGTTVPGTGTLQLGIGSAVTNFGAQFPQHRLINRLTFQMQGIAPLYDVDGEVIPFLQFYGRGNPAPWFGNPVYASFGFAVVGATPTAFQFPFTFPTMDTTSVLGMISQYGPYAAYNSGATSVTVGYQARLPLTEWLRFPDQPMMEPSGNQRVHQDEIEVGLLYMQTSTQNVRCSTLLNPIYALAATGRVVLLATGNATASLANQTWLIQDKFYDIPLDPQDMPADLQVDYAIQTLTFDTAVAGGQATIKHTAAGLLLKCIYLFYNDTTNFGQLVDITTGSSATTLQFSSGTNVIRSLETVDINAFDAFMDRGVPPPGSAAFDFMLDGTWTQCIDTGKLGNVQTIIKALPAGPTRVNTTEVRLIPVSAGA